MSWRHLGEVFDIHGGGVDLVFPHHENEIAQTRCAFGHSAMANVWMHNGFLQVEGEKMSKSLGNFVTIHELLNTENFGGRRWPGAVLRLAMLRAHYRQPIDWTAKALEEADAALRRLHEAAGSPDGPPSEQLLEALGDDLNTPAAIAELHALRAAGKRDRLAASLKLMGLWAPELYQSDVDPAFAAKVDALVAARLDARRAKNWTESDRLRDEIAALGVSIKDGKDGTTWELKR
jgi:cysteinyl-tRNA synthetase